MNWEFYAARRKISLEAFTKNAANLYEAKKIFEHAGIDLPVDNSLNRLFEGTSDKLPESGESADQNKSEEKSATATSNWLESGDPSQKSTNALPKTSVDYLEMGVKPTKEEANDDDKSSDTKS